MSITKQQRYVLHRLLFNAGRKDFGTAHLLRVGNPHNTHVYRLNLHGFPPWVPKGHVAVVWVDAFNRNHWSAQSWRVSLHRGSTPSTPALATLENPDTFEELVNWARMVDNLTQG